MKKLQKTFFLAIAFTLSYPVVAQNIIQRIDTPYSKVIETQPKILGLVKSLGAQETIKSIEFEVISTDKTIREVLKRWSQDAGWKHESVHWGLVKDYPVEGTATADYFKGDFKTAVRLLLSSTQTTDLPAQPCFYTNKIVRVISQAAICDRASTNNQ